ncbi:MAG: hypothetical protein M1827_000849 [Pycnora praestabilis]|nr:MAG: hypothetical protein M1827_000849 [Pycnora praestabilis]
MTLSGLPFPKAAKEKANSSRKTTRTNKTDAGVKKAPQARNGIRSKPTAYNRFGENKYPRNTKVKENHASLKAQNPGMDGVELRALVSKLWKDDHTNPNSSTYDGPAVTSKKC